MSNKNTETDAEVQEMMQEVAYQIAEKNPSILIDALRSNGFWMYVVHKQDLAEQIEESKKDQDLLPVTNYDMVYFQDKQRVADAVDYNELLNEMVLALRIKKTNAISDEQKHLDDEKKNNKI